MKRIVIGFLLAAAPHPAWADCPSLPFALTNGTIANADQVMADLNCLMTKSSFTGPVSISGAASWPPILEVDGIGRFVSPNNGSTGGVVIRDAAGDPDGNYLQFVNNANSSQYATIRALKTGGLVLYGGNVGIGGTYGTGLLLYVNGASGGIGAWSNISDGRLKTNVQPITDALQYVTRLQGVRYQWLPKADRSLAKSAALPESSPQVGFIAQDVAKIIPEAVNTPANADEPYSLKPTDIIPFLVESIKAQQAQIKSLEDRIDKIDSRSR